MIVLCLSCYCCTISVSNQTQFRSSFGGLWTDSRDSKLELELRQRAGLISKYEYELLTHWIDFGYIILRSAVPGALCDQIALQIKKVFIEGSHAAMYSAPDSPAGVASHIPKNLQPEQMKIVDFYAVSRDSAEALASPVIVDFLELIFRESPLCFQGLTFEKGSEQGFHQDTAYVVIKDEPMHLAAAWIALEDIREGSGELMYIEGSHKLPDWKFGGASKHWNRSIHGDIEHQEWARWLIQKSADLGLRHRLFRPQKGDVLIWSADLVHGGSLVTNHNLTRRSLVGHYCPLSRNPNYFQSDSSHDKILYKNCYFSSQYYRIDSDNFKD